jgi:hypothetical protein
VIRFLGRTQPGKREREKSNGKDCEEESEAGPQGQNEADDFQALRQRPSQGDEARSSGSPQDQGTSPRSLTRATERFAKSSAGLSPQAASGRNFLGDHLKWPACASQTARKPDGEDKVDRKAALISPQRAGPASAENAKQFLFVAAQTAKEHRNCGLVATPRC